MKFLIVIDMQNDFITGSLKNDDAKKIVSSVENKIKNFDGEVIFTQDTHSKKYLKTQEGKNLPVKHCIKNTWGWEICDELKPYVKTNINKPTFGSLKLPKLIKSYHQEIEEIEIVGICTDICVISNAMILKASFPEVEITVDSSLCAGVTKESHNNALNAMKATQIKII